VKRISVFLLALAASTAMAAAQGATTTIRWAYWGSDARIKRSQAAIDLFTAANPKIAVNPEISGGTGDHFLKVDTAIAGGGGPDIIQMGGNIADYVNKGVLLPLEKYSPSILNTSVIDQGALESGTINGHLYGISTGVTMPALFYNKTLIQKIGAPLPKVSMTYAEFRAYLVALKAKLPSGVYPLQDFGAQSSNSTPFGYWARYNGTPLFDPANKTTAVTAEAAQKYLELFKDYRDNGLIPPADISAGYAETNADTSSVIAGKAAIGFIWTNSLGGYQAATKDELALIELPGAAANKALWQAPSQFYTVNKSSKNIEAAVRFINFLVNNPDAARVLGNDRGASASSAARTALLSDVNDQKVIEYLKVAGAHSSRETQHLPNDSELNSTFYLIYQKVAFGQLPSAQGGKQIYALITRLIKK